MPSTAATWTPRWSAGGPRGAVPDRGLLGLDVAVLLRSALRRGQGTVDECKDKDMTYAAPLFVTAEFINNNTGEIKSQTVFMGDFPMMTEKGTFIINGTERVVVSQLVRFAGRVLRRDDRQVDREDAAQRQGHPRPRCVAGVRRRQARHRRRAYRPQAPAAGHRAAEGAGWTNEQITERFGFSEIMMGTLEKDNTAGTDEALLDIYRKLRPGEPPTKESAQTCWRTCSSRRSATTWPGWAATRSTRSWASTPASRSPARR